MKLTDIEISRTWILHKIDNDVVCEFSTEKEVDDDINYDYDAIGLYTELRLL